jgi:hypothetical protein
MVAFLEHKKVTFNKDFTSNVRHQEDIQPTVTLHLLPLLSPNPKITFQCDILRPI